ncbi:hypothetical protein AHAS_Ahas20G0074900 [Arachis hypogaea]
MEGTANVIVYRNGEIIRNTHEGVRFVCQNPFSFVVPCTMMFIELQNGLCQSMENSILMRVSSILYRNPIIIFGGLIQFDIMPIIDEESMQNIFQIHRQTQMRQPQIELYVEFEDVETDEIQNDLDIEDDRATVYEGMNSDIEEDFEVGMSTGQGGGGGCLPAPHPRPQICSPSLSPFPAVGEYCSPSPFPTGLHSPRGPHSLST